jgi:hypothetical protein
MKIVFINGLPRAGKDTLANFICQIGCGAGIRAAQESSIDPVRDAFKSMGIDVTNKTPELRAAMAEVGDSLENWLSFRSKWCVKKALHYDANGYHILIIHMREPDLIAKTCDLLNRYGYETIKVFLESKRAEHVDSNAADTGVWRDDFYDRTLFNDGPLSELRKGAVELLKKLKPGLAEDLR